MFDFVRKHTKLFQFILLLLIFPSFVFFGIQGYSSFAEAGNASVATVAGQAITKAEWDAAHRDQSDRVRRQNPNIDAKLFDSAEAKKQSLEGLMHERVLQAAAKDQHVSISDERLQTMFASDPQFAFLRNPDGTLNKAMLAAQGMSSELFVQRLRQDLTLNQVTRGINSSALAGTNNVNTAFDALLQQREVQVQRFDAKNYLDSNKPTDAQIETYYKDPKHAVQFQAPEQAQIEYLVLNLDAIKKNIKVAEADLRKYYDENLARYTVAEERRASHILIKADKSASTDERTKAKSKADELLVQARKAPGDFAELARKNSQDPGSAEKGGDLDFFGKGQMAEPFEKAAYALKQGEISAVVESDYGYHIILLTGARGGEKKPYESVQTEIEDEVRKQLAQKEYSAAAEQFGNLVYEQADSLKPTADKLHLTVQTATISRQPAPGTQGALANAKLLDALFAAESLRTKHNTEAIDLGSFQMASGRIVQYTAAHQRPLADVKPLVSSVLAAELSANAARKEGEARLAALRAGGDATGLGEASVLSRAQTRDLPGQIIDGVLKADASKLPTWVGVDLGKSGYAVAKISKLLPRDPAVVDATRAAQQYQQAWATAEAQAYYAALKVRFKAQVKTDALPVDAAASGVLP